MKILLLSIFLMFAPYHFASANDEFPFPNKIDCTAVCGTKFCCVALNYTIPVCRLKKNSKIEQKINKMDVQSIKDIGKICDEQKENEDEVKKLLSRNQKIDSLDTLSCKWGCCNSAKLASVLTKTPRLATHYFPKSAGKSIEKLAMDSRNKDGEEKLVSAIDHVTQGLCIFCCTF